MGNQLSVRPTNKLTAIAVEKQKRLGRHSDGGGLYLNVTKSGSKSWVFNWSRNHRKQEIGLGPYPAVLLAKARARAEQCREQVADDINPDRRSIDTGDDRYRGDRGLSIALRYTAGSSSDPARRKC